MASIKTYLDAIKAAVYGEEVRGSIHDAIKAIYDISTGAQGSATASANTAIAKASEAVAAAKEVTAKAGEAIEAAEQAQISAENAEAATGVGIASQKKAGLVKGGENYIDESGELQLTKRTDFPTLYNSYAGGIKLNELGGASEQDSTTGAQLFDVYNTRRALGSDTTVTISDIGRAVTVRGKVAYANVQIDIPSDVFNSIKGTRVSFYGNIVSKTVSTSATALNLVVVNADNTKIYYAYSNKPTVVIPADAKSAYVELNVNNTSTDLSETNTVVFENIMLNAGSTALPWEPYTDNAASPSSEYPQVIKPVEGKNLLDCRGLVEQTVNGGKFTPVYDDNGNLLYIEVDGTFTARSAYLLNRIATSEECIVSGAPTNGRIQVTSADTQYNDYGSGTTIPSGFEGSVYIIVDANTTLTNLKFYPMIRPASIADDTYVPYGLLRLWGHGKNFCHISKSYSGYRETDVAYYDLTQYRHFKVFLKAGTYTISEHQATNKFLRLIRIVSGSYYYPGTTTITNGSYTFYHPKDEDVYFCFGRASTATGTSITDVFSEMELLKFAIQIERGSEATSYESNQSITLSDPIKLNGVGTAQDKIVRKDGVWKIERNVPEVVFDGSDDEAWIAETVSNQSGIRFKINLGNCVSSDTDTNGIHSLNTHFRLGINGATWDECDVYTISGSSGNLLLAVTGITTLADFKMWLVENPITVQYEAAQPTYEDLPTADQIALNSIVSYDGITYLYCDSEVHPTWDLEYGTSRVGGYVLEAWNTAMSEKILNEARYNEIVAAMLVMNQE